MDWRNASVVADRLIDEALAEDGAHQDLTTCVVLGDVREHPIQMRIEAEEEGWVAGLWVVRKVFERLAPAHIQFTAHVQEGTPIEAGTTVCQIAGPARALLAGERVALNFLSVLSGVATHTAQMLQKIARYNVILLDTRKTLPGWRALLRWAVRTAGGRNHRWALDDAILVKDNHWALLNYDYRAGFARLRHWYATTLVPRPVVVEIPEPSVLEEVLPELDWWVDKPFRLLLDNFSPEAVRTAREVVPSAIPIEVSGGITLDNIEAYARAGIQYISVGALTRHVHALNFHAEIVSANNECASSSI